jgi:predicted ATPase
MTVCRRRHIRSFPKRSVLRGISDRQALDQRTAADRREEAAFEIVGHFNRASALVTSRDEREHVAELNLMAGKRAKKAAGLRLRTDLSDQRQRIAGQGRTQRHELVFELELHRAECEFLIGEVASAEERLKTLSSRAASVLERAAVVLPAGGYLLRPPTP